MNAAEHFAWARTRALEYVERDDPGNAMASLIQDLRSHEGTAGILHPDLQTLFLGEILIGGTAGARSFIKGLAGPNGG